MWLHRHYDHINRTDPNFWHLGCFYKLCIWLHFEKLWIKIHWQIILSSNYFQGYQFLIGVFMSIKPHQHWFHYSLFYRLWLPIRASWEKRLSARYHEFAWSTRVKGHQRVNGGFSNIQGSSPNPFLLKCWRWSQKKQTCYQDGEIILEL